MDNASETGYSSPEAASQHQGPRASMPERPCDTCRKRKSRCVKEPGQLKCVLCSFHQRDCTFLDEPQKRKRSRLDAGLDAEAAFQHQGASGAGHKKTSSTPFISNAAQFASQYKSAGRSLLDETLGLHRTTHSKYIGASSLHDAYLHHLQVGSPLPGDGEDRSSLRRVDVSTTFVNLPDGQAPFHADDDEDLEAIEQIVQPHGPALVHLYFRIVHPSYPILHKGVFLEKYGRTYKEFSPPLLAAVYLLAMDWWEYDRDLSAGAAPDGAKLIKAATKTLTSAIHRPKLSTVQAGLLLLQRSGGDSWPLTSQIVAVGEELGLHLDCSSWDIPDWEKGLRRRLTWALYLQDKWSASIHGRPSHISPANWQTRKLGLDDFPESAADEDDNEGSTEVEKGRHLFIHLTRLTEITAQVLDTLYGLDQSHIHQLLHSAGITGLLELVKPMAVELKEWASGMPASLRMEDVKTRKLCSNGYLHLSYFATEMMIHRCIVRSISPDTASQLRTLCRDAAGSRLDRAMAFVEALRPEHLQGFWWFASSKCLALIGSYAALLWATSADPKEAELYRQKLEDFRWSLKVRAKGSSFLLAAIREMDDCLGDVDFKQPPLAAVARESETPTDDTLDEGFSHARTSQPGNAGPCSQDSYGYVGGAPSLDIFGYDTAAAQSLFSDLDELGLTYPLSEPP